MKGTKFVASLDLNFAKAPFLAGYEERHGFI
jgi:hypothetical protein